MRYIPYGYRIEDGKAVLDEEQAAKVVGLFEGYLSGLALRAAAEKVGLDIYHGTAKRMLGNKKYLGDAYYPKIINQDTFDRTEAERIRRATSLGRIREAKEKLKKKPQTCFYAEKVEIKYSDPFKQAEYAYSLIESEG
ncbi:MAG: recombinase [Lachnospiraceae bacterium]|nr:recombinase [Lachnospiraceae bacterium]